MCGYPDARHACLPSLLHQVKLFAVLNKPAASGGSADDEDVVGFFFIDMHPREGKYGHAAAFPLISPCEKDGAYQSCAPLFTFSV